MKIWINLILCCMILFLSCEKADSITTPGESTDEQWLYTMTGEGLIIDAEAKTMTIVHADENLIAFTDRPVRKTYLSTPQWLAAYWNRGDDSFQADPPNAELSYYSSDGSIHVNLVLEMF